MKTTVLPLVLLLLLPLPAVADDLVLVDGRYLQVKVLGATEKALHVRLLDNGGEIWIPWELIRQEDRDRLMIRFGYKEEERAEITRPGVRLVTRIGEEFYGVPVEEFDDQDIPDPFVIMHRGREWSFKRDVVRTIERREVPALEAYSREQLYEQELGRVQPGEEDLAGHMDMAEFCMAIDLYTRAVEHLLKVREIDPIYREDFVINQLERMEALARNQRIVEAIGDARREARYKRFDRSVQMLDQIMAMEDLDPQLHAKAQLSKEAVLEWRRKYFKKEIARGYFRLLNSKIGKMSRDHDLELKQAQRELRRDLHKEIVADLAREHGLDPKEVEELWKEREVFHPRRSWYASGSFIVLGKAKGAEKLNQQLQRQMARALQQRRRSRSDQGGFSQPLQLPKPPTAEEWWEKLASANTKASWMRAYFAERGRELKVVGELRDSCGRCGGTGTIKFSGAQGQTIPVICPRCHGHKHDRGIAYQ